MEIGETIGDCCIREVKEETGLSVKISRLVGIYSDPLHVIQYRDGEVRQQFSICFECVPIDGELSADHEVLELKWFDLPDLPADIHPAQLVRISDWAESSSPCFQ